MEQLSIEHAIATALCRLMPSGDKKDVDWRLLADEFVSSVAGVVALVPREEYDRTTTALRDARKQLSAFGVR